MRFLTTFLCGVLVVLAPRAGRAWVETQIQSSTAQIDVDRAGAAVVAHELVLQVRGGPLTAYQLEGVDADAEVLGDGTVVNTATPSAPPLPLLVERRDDGTLSLELEGKGIRRGTWLFRFRYRTQLAGRGALEPVGDRVRLSWVGPRHPQGVDSMKVVFRLPAAPEAPSAPQVDREAAALGLTEEPGGVFLSQVRRSADADELELVRPRVARGEPVVWRALVSPAAFDAFAPPTPPPVLAEPVRTPAPVSADPPVLVAALLVAGAFYAGLVALKHRLAAQAAARRHAVTRPLLPLPRFASPAVAGVGVALSIFWAVLEERPTLAAIALGVALLAAALVTPLATLPPRGPGRWLPLKDDDAFTGARADAPGAWLDAGTPRGFLAFALLLATAAASSLWLFARTPYHALQLALGSSLLVPVFLTGRGAELPADAALEPRSLLRWLALELRARGLGAAAWARIPRGAREPDELRLLLTLPAPVHGLLALEVAVEHLQTEGGAFSLPCVLVRAIDDSAAHRSLPRSVSWTRGRTAEERVAVLRPRLPGRRETLALCVRLAGLLSYRGPAGKKTTVASPMPLTRHAAA